MDTDNNIYNQGAEDGIIGADLEVKSEDQKDLEYGSAQGTDAADALKAIRKFTDEESADDDMGNITWKSVLGGDVLQTKFLMHQVVFVMFVVVLALLYTGNRYSGQQDLITIDNLKNELQDCRYEVLTQSSDLLSKTLQSKIEKLLIENGDTDLVKPSNPPIVIVPKEGEEGGEND